MTTQSEGADRAPLIPLEQPQFREYVVRRDKERPLGFAGVQLARAVRQGAGQLVVLAQAETLEAAVYKTRGGKFITALAKTREASYLDTARSLIGGVEEEASPDAFGYHKAAVHETLEDAVAWFRPGRLTDEIRKQLGFDEPIRIE